MAERPLLILPAFGDPRGRAKKNGGPDRTATPTRDRQRVRLAPRFDALQQALDARRIALQTQPAGVVPEEVVVLETVGPVDKFIEVVRATPGLEWLGEVDEEDIPPDEDFFPRDSKNRPKRDKPMRGRIFLVFTNHSGLRQLLALWQAWLAGLSLPAGLTKWGEVFTRLRDVRTWNANDRLAETGALTDWQARVANNQALISCEVELWFRRDPQTRSAARARVAALIAEFGGKVVHDLVLEEIEYHALLAQLPGNKLAGFLNETNRDALFLQCEQVQFFRAAGQMAGIMGRADQVLDPRPAPAMQPVLGDPIVALFDGLPLQNHVRLAGRLFIDDPDGYGNDYPVHERSHGTAMASLILHGDLNSGELPLNRKLYVRPILRPDKAAWFDTRPETCSDQVLLLDLVHRSVRRLFETEGAEKPAAPTVCVINLSIGIRDRPFDGGLTPLARLLDWLAWKYSVLFLVSAGNHVHEIEIPASAAAIAAMPPDDLQFHVLRSVAADARNRRLLSPAEAVNVLTIGATHTDSSTEAHPPGSVAALTAGLPSVINAQGMGYRRTIKPELLFPGGRVSLRVGVHDVAPTLLEVVTQKRPPGQRVAAPGYQQGDINYTLHTHGTSSATALASRSAHEIYDVVESLKSEQGGERIDDVPRAVWIKALLAHSATWGAAGDTLTAALRNKGNGRQFKEYLTRLVGYGVADPSRIRECTAKRATILGCGRLTVDQAHVHRLPLPPSLSGRTEWRRLIITLASLTPIHPGHRSWRRADVWFTPSHQILRVNREEADYHAVQRGTLQHEVLEGKHAAVYVDGDELEILVSCRADAGSLDDSVPYALAVTVEVGEESNIDIYNEIRLRVMSQVQVTSTP